MIRTIITIILPLITPTVAYLIFLWFTYKNREAEEEGRRLPEWRTWPWVNLIGGGSLLVVITLGSIALFGEHRTDVGDYQPPRLQDGKIVPYTFSEDD